MVLQSQPRDTLGLINKPDATEPFEDIKTPKEQCIASGGVWDEASQTCQRGTDKGKKGVDVSETEESTDEFKSFKDEGTGKLSGFVSEGGATFLGVDPKTVREEGERQAERRQLVVGGEAEALSSSQLRQREQGLDLSSQVGQAPIQQLESEFSAQGVNYVSAIASGVPGLFPDFLSGAGTFATGALALGQAGPQVATPEEVITVPTAALIGGVGNAIRGFYSDFVSDVKRQKREIIETPIRTLTETKSIMNDIISGQNANPAEATQNLEAFNSQLQLVDDEFDRLKELTGEDLNKFLGVGGINQMQEYEVYYAPNGERDRQIREMQIALANPDPSKVRVGGDTLKQLNDRIDQEVKKIQTQ